MGLEWDHGNEKDKEEEYCPAVTSPVPRIADHHPIVLPLGGKRASGCRASREVRVDHITVAD